MVPGPSRVYFLTFCQPFLAGFTPLRSTEHLTVARCTAESRLCGSQVNIWSSQLELSLRDVCRLNSGRKTHPAVDPATSDLASASNLPVLRTGRSQTRREPTRHHFALKWPHGDVVSRRPDVRTCSQHPQQTYTSGHASIRRNLRLFSLDCGCMLWSKERVSEKVVNSS